MADMINQMQESSRSLQLMLGGIGGVAMLVAAISICNTMLMSIYERTREIGVMKVLGCKMSKIGAMFLTEAGIIGLGGGILGLSISYILSWVINTVIAANGAGDTFRSVIPFYLAMGALVFSILVGVLAGLYPLSARHASERAGRHPQRINGIFQTNVKDGVLRQCRKDPLFAHWMGFPPRPGSLSGERSAPSCFIKGIRLRRIPTGLPY